jgi:hypothetical protein
LDVSKNSKLNMLECNYNYIPSPNNVIGWQALGLVLENNLIFYPQKILYGDVNGDGVVDPLDITRLLRYFSGVDSSDNNFNAANADVNGDGVLDPLDITRLLRYFSGVDPSPLGPKMMPAAMPLPTAAPDIDVAGGPLVKVSSASGKAGDVVTLTVTLENNPGIPAFYLSLPYDKDRLTYVSAAAGDIVDSNFVALDQGDSIIVSAVSANGAEIKSGSVLFTVKFKIKAGVKEVGGMKPFYTFGGIESGEKLQAWDISPGQIMVETGPAYNYSVYLTPEKTALKAGDTLLVDVMLKGDINYTQRAAELAYDSGLLEFAGYANLRGWVAAVNAVAPGKAAVRSMPSMNMVLGEPCAPAVRIVTLKFTVKDGFAGESVTTALSLPTIVVTPPGGVAGATVAPAEAVTVSLKGD